MSGHSIFAGHFYLRASTGITTGPPVSFSALSGADFFSYSVLLARFWYPFLTSCFL